MAREIFLSYRRAESDLVGQLQDKLRRDWGLGQHIFRDIAIPGGESWDSFIRDRVDEADIVLVVAGPRWSFFQPGRDPAAVDYVRVELEKALRADKPVLVVDVDRPRSAVEDFPPDLKAQQRWQSLAVSKGFEPVEVRRVVDALKRLGFVPPTDTDPFSLRLSLGLQEEEADVAKAVRDAARGGGAVLPFVVVKVRPGVGRRSLLRAVADHLRHDHLVLGGDVDPAARNRSYATIAGWFADLTSGAGAELAASKGFSNAALARLLVTYGRDLLSRDIVPGDQLGDLGDDALELEVVRASTRRDLRYATPDDRRIHDQVLRVLQEVQRQTGTRLVAVVGDLHRTDEASLAAIRHLRTHWVPPGRPRSAEQGWDLVLLGSRVDGMPAPDLSSPGGPAVGRPRVDRRQLDPVEVDLAACGVLDVEARVRKVLERRAICVDDAVVEAVANAHPASPFYCLASLNYLATQGQLTPRPPSGGPAGDDGGSAPELQVERWVPIGDWAGAGAVPGVPALLEHLVDGAVAPRLRAILEVGSLMPFPFPFDVAHEVARSRRPDLDEPDECWRKLRERNPPGSVLQVPQVEDGRRWVGMHRELAAHLSRRLTVAERRALHATIARTAERRADECGDHLDARYGLVALAAEQWTLARCFEPAARAHRSAAELAEGLLAFGPARRHYELAALAHDHCREVHEHGVANRLGSAHARYRLGRLQLLAGESGEAAFRAALAEVDEARELLLQRKASLGAPALVAPAGGSVEAASRTAPVAEDLDRCAALSAYVHFYRAQQARLEHGPGTSQAVSLFHEALQEAEAAAGAFDSRWVVAAASARLATLMVEEVAASLSVPVAGGHTAAAKDRRRLEVLVANATFHAERAAGMRGATPEEDHHLAEPRAWAFEALGRLHQWASLDPAVATWYFDAQRLASSSHHSEVLERRADLAYALFQLSLLEGDELGRLGLALARTARPRTGGEPASTVAGPPVGDGPRGRRAGAEPSDRPTTIARLLVSYQQWSDATRLPDHLASAQAGLALAWLAAAGGDPGSPWWAEAVAWVEDAAGMVDDSTQAMTRILLLGGLIADVSADPATAVDRYRRALRLDGDDRGDLHLGRRAAFVRLLMELPLVAKGAIEGWYLQQAQRDPVVAEALTRAERYATEAARCRGPADFDTFAVRLGRARLPTAAREHAERTAATALDLAAEALGDEPPEVLLAARRDLTLAAWAHDWYRDVEGARLLALAREWDLSVSGVEWANPVLLHGRLAVEAIRRLYHGERRVGADRFQRLEQLLAHHTTGNVRAGLLDKVFVLADWRARPDGHDEPLPSGLGLDDAYVEVHRRKAQRVLAHGGHVSPDTEALLAAGTARA